MPAGPRTQGWALAPVPQHRCSQERPTGPTVISDLAPATAIHQLLGPVLGRNFLCPKEQLAPPQSQQVSAPTSIC